MRLTLQDWTDLGLPPVVVYLDGEPIHDAIMADEEQGLVEVLRKTDDGHYIVVGDKVQSEVRSGYVEIRFDSENIRRYSEHQINQINGGDPGGT